MSLFNLDDPQQVGLLSLGLRLMSTPGRLGQALGQSGLGAMSDIQQATQARQRNELMKLQMSEAQMRQKQMEEQQRRQRLIEEAARMSMRTPEQAAMAGGGGPTMENAAKIDPSAGPQFDQSAFLNRVAGVDPLMSLEWRQKLAKQTPQPTVSKPGDIARDPVTGKILWQNPEDGTTKDKDLALLEMLHGKGTPAFMAAAAKLAEKRSTHSPAARVEVNTRQESEEAKAVGKMFGEQYSTIQAAGLAATGKLNKLDRMGSLIQGVSTGKLAPAGKEAASYLRSVGINVDPSLGNKEAIESLSNEMALEMRNPSGGAGMPGAMSDQDRAFLQNIVPSLSKTPEGNRMMIETARRLAKRDQEVAKLARNYRMRNGSIDEGFHEELAAFSEKNPLFGDLAVAPAQGEWSIRPKGGR